MKSRLVLTIPFLLAFPLVAAAREPGAAKGTVTFNGKATNLVYAYAWKEKSLFGKDMDTVVVLSDSKLDDAALGDRIAKIHLARDGKFTGIQLSINPKGEIESLTFFAHALELGFMDSGGIHEWAKKTASSTMIEGKVSTKPGEHDFFGMKYSDSVDFKASIGPAPKK